MKSILLTRDWEQHLGTEVRGSTFVLRHISMKFGALLRSSAEHSPELQGLFVCYKQLKKKIKQLPVGQVTGGVRDGRRAELAEASFVQIINADVLQFNDLFIEREEDCVIRLGSIEDAADAASTPAEIAQVC